MLKKHGDFLISIFLLKDIIIIIFSWILAYYIRFPEFFLQNYKTNDFLHKYLYIIVPIMLLWSFIFKNMGLYKQRRVLSVYSEIFDIIKASTLSLLILITSMYFIKETFFSRSVFLFFWIISILILSIERFFLRKLLRYLRRKGYNTKNVLVIGGGELGERLIRKIHENLWTGLIVKGIIDDKKKYGEMIENIKIIGKMKQITEIINKYNIDQVFIALPIQQYRKLMFINEKLKDQMVSVRVFPDIYQVITLNASIEEFDGLPLINLTDTPMYGWSAILKRMADIVFSLIAVIITSPLMIVIGFVIKMSSRGPIIFKQRRFGLDGKEIKVYKFRSMTVCENDDNFVQAKKGDARITPVGAFLRRTSLDELPQFINVLQGRMSIVGPRPHPVAQNEQFRKIVTSYMMRHKVKPGITGWAQVNGWRGETDTLGKMEKRIEYDLYYIKHWSVLLDVKIMWLTLWKGMINDHA